MPKTTNSKSNQLISDRSQCQKILLTGSYLKSKSSNSLLFFNPLEIYFQITKNKKCYILTSHKILQIPEIEAIFKHLRTDKEAKKMFSQANLETNKFKISLQKIAFFVHFPKTPICLFSSITSCFSGKDAFRFSDFYVKKRSKQNFLISPAQFKAIFDEAKPEFVNKMMLENPEDFEIWYLYEQFPNESILPAPLVYLVSSIDSQFDSVQISEIKENFSNMNFFYAICSSNSFSVYELTI